MSFKKILALILAVSFPIAVYARGNTDSNPTQPYLNIIAPNVIDGVTVNPSNAAPGNFTTLSASSFSPTGSINTQGIVFSQAPSGNPLMQLSYKDIPTASVVATGGYALLSGVSGRTIYPSPGMTVMTSGTGATGSRIIIECTSGNILMSAPIAAMVSGIPFAPFSSTLTYAGTAFNRGCAVSDAVLVSMVGGLTTTTDVYVNMPYSVQ